MKHKYKPKAYLVGAGPGNPGLITVKGLELIKEAQVIIYDQLGTKHLMKHAREDAELIDVGKRAGKHTVPQDEINKIIIAKTKEKKIVVRLKGGDPTVFGRGGEEAEELAKENLDFEIVPGITSAVSAPIFAGIPVTHRDCTSAMAIVTGHEASKESSSLDWDAISKIGTIVILMGVKNLPKIVNHLIKAGRSKSTKVALIQNGTLPVQKVASGTLENICSIVKEKKISPPAVTIIGEVVGLREKMQWFEKQPLFGKSIVVTRSRKQASALSDKLSELGAEVLEFPTIKIKHISINKEFETFVGNHNQYSHLVFTSTNGVESFLQGLFDLSKDFRILANKKIICIGPATANEFLKRGIKPDFVPDTYVAESLVEHFESEKCDGKIAILRAAEARNTLPNSLKKMGKTANVISLYQTELTNTEDTELIELIRNKKIDFVTFTSSSTVKGFLKLISNSDIDLKAIPAAAIGPITAETATSAGMTMKCIAKKFTIDGLIDEILRTNSEQSK